MGELIQFIPHTVNGVTIEQRNTDGFINGTAMCKAHGKDMYSWLRQDSVFDLVSCLALRLSIKPRTVKKRDAGSTKVSSIYPDLVIVKRGNGAGTWIHPKLAVHLAQWCNTPFALQVSDWIEEWLLTGKNPVQSQPDVDKEYIAWQERYDIRIELKDILRPELMEVSRAYAVANSLSPITVCSRVHDIMNERIQGAKARDIKVLNGLPLADLLRDYFDTKPLHIYAAINRIAINKIVDSNINPMQAVQEACDDYLGGRYTPKLFQKAENLYIQQRRVQKALKAKQAKAVNPYQQLNLFDNGEAV
jgi:hypothetical protein